MSFSNNVWKVMDKIEMIGYHVDKSGLRVNMGYQFDRSGIARDKPLHSCGRDLIVLVRRRPLYLFVAQ